MSSGLSVCDKIVILAPIMEHFLKILQAVTVSSRDDGEHFTDTTRVEAIEALLDGSGYEQLHKGPLSLLYGRRRPTKGERVVLVSSHIDCVFSRCFCADRGETLHGTFDNSYTNAAVIWNMLHGKFADNVIVAFTGDEEQDSRGAVEALCALGLMQCSVAFAIVLDVTEEGWRHDALFTIENDLGVDIFTAHRLVELLRPYNGRYYYVHNAEPDESWDYDEYGVPCFTLCAPILGDMHSDEGVLLRKASFPAYADFLSQAANTILG